MLAKDKSHLRKGQFLFCTCALLWLMAGNSFAQSQMSAREHIVRGNQFLSRRAFQQALDEYQEALKLEPNNATAKGNILVAHNNWGMYYALKKDWQHANQEFEACLQLDPNFHDAARNLNLLKRDMAKDMQENSDQPWDPRADGEANEKPSQAKKTEAKKAEAKGKQEAPSAVILTPGLKSTTTATESTNTTDATSTSAPNATVAPTNNASNYGNQFFSTDKNAGSGTIDQQLSAVEMKVYGHKQEDMPVLKRLEKLETDTSGSISQGTIKDRIEHLKQSFGI